MARMIFFLLSIPAAVGGSFVTATPSVNNRVAATNVSLLTDEFPTCVDGSQFADWSEGIIPISCDNAVRAVRAVVENERRLYLDYEFYSRLYPPRRMPAHGWPLPQGATNGNCAFTIRMAKDFGHNSLPMRGGGYRPPNRGPYQKLSTWNHIFRVVELLYNGCTSVAGGGKAGWSMVADGIVVSFWPRNSTMNLRYGPSIRLSIESPNVTDVMSD